MKGREKFFTVLILGSLSAIGPFSIDMYLPGFPDIAKDLNTTVPEVALSLSGFFIGVSCGQLLYGPLLDRYGRKPPLIAGIILYLAASTGCVFAGSVNALIVLRFLQGLGGCAGMVASRAFVRDIFPVNELAKIFSLLMLVIAVSPIIAPTAGGFITTHLGWRYIFVVLSLLALIVLTAIFFVLPQGKLADKEYSLRPKNITLSFITVLKNPQFATYAFTGAFASAGLYAYLAGSPHVFMELYKVSPNQYSLIFAIVAMGLITASQVNSLLLRRYSSEQIIRVASVFQSLSAIIMCVAIIANVINVYGMVICLFCFLSSQGFIFPNSSALSLAPFIKNAGTASALLGAIQMAIGTLSTSVVSFFSNEAALPMAATMMVCTALSLSILLTGRKILYRKTSTPTINQQMF